jgi:spore germination cell wall hydrolase CwlJ-like protein
MVSTLLSVTYTMSLAIVTGFAYVSMSVTPYVEPEIYPIDMSIVESQSIAHEISYYKTSEKLKLSAKDLKCLEHNIYYEAGVEDYAGKIAVAQVTLNRLKTNRWGNTICKVVYAPHQFSWTKQNKEKPKGKLWEESKHAAQDFIDGVRIQSLKKSMFYHATWMEEKPNWANHKIQVKEIGQHVFYRKPEKLELASN